jgi:hypothetical protein
MDWATIECRNALKPPANPSDGAILTGTVAASIPLAVGIVCGGEVILGVGTVGGTVTAGGTATTGGI